MRCVLMIISLKTVKCEYIIIINMFYESLYALCFLLLLYTNKYSRFIIGSVKNVFLVVLFYRKKLKIYTHYVLA